MIELQRLVLAGLRDGTVERWVFSLPRLTEYSFTDDNKSLFLVVRRIFQVTGYPPSRNSFNLAISTLKDKSLSARLNGAWDDLPSDPPTDAEFKMALHQLAEVSLDVQFNTAIATSLEIAARTTRVDGHLLEGREAARQYLIEQLSGLAVRNGTTASDILIETTDVLKEYDAAKSDRSSFVKVGIQSIDSVTHGMEPSDLMMIEGFTGDGKTQLCCNFAHNVAFVFGRNVLYITSETLRQRVRRRLVSRHSMEPQFKIHIPYSDLKHGELTEQGETALHDVLDDMDKGRQEGRYGGLFVVNASRQRTIRDHIREVRQLAGRVELVIVDYLALMGSAFDRAALTKLIIDTKALAIDEEVVIATPWQTSIAAWERARKDGSYSKAAMAEASEAEKSADSVLAILRDGAVLNARFTKMRDEAEGDVFYLNTDLRYSWVGDQSSRLGQVHL